MTLPTLVWGSPQWLATAAGAGWASPPLVLLWSYARAAGDALGVRSGGGDAQGARLPRPGCSAWSSRS